MAKKVTAHNTGLSIKRNGSKFTATWKIKASSVSAQWIRYRTYNKKWSKWTTKKLGEKATSYSFSLSASASKTKLQVQTQTQRKPTKDWNVSEWKNSSTSFTFKAPPAPGLSVSNDSPNASTFTWSHANNSSNSEWLRHCLFRTKCGGKWSTWKGVGATGSRSYTDSVVGQTRVFQVKAQGPAGTSKIVEQQHIIGAPPVASWGKNGCALVPMPLYYKLTYDINLKASKYAVDSITPQYYIGVPTAAVGCPAETNWTNGPVYSFSASKTSYVFTLSTSTVLAPDQCLFARIKTLHDDIESGSAIKRVKVGTLGTPVADISVSTPTTSGFTVTVDITDVNSSLPGVYQQVYLEKNSKPGVENYVPLGSIPNGSSSAEIVSALNITKESGYAIHVRNASADGKTMTSGYYTYSTSMPSAPRLNSVTATPVSGKVHVAWTNRWAAATGIQIAWTDDQDNWKSNDDPAIYDIDEVVSDWFIVGLETGTTWYFRVRSVRTQGDVVNYSPWSTDVSIDLSAAPAVPILYLSAEAITEDGMATAYWSYVSTDGTGQISGSIVEATRNGDSWTYGKPIESTISAQHIDLYARDHGWTNGTTVYLALQTGSGSGGISDYSTPVQLVIAAKPTVEIAVTSLQTTEDLTEFFTGDGETAAFTCQYSLASAPTVTVDGETAPVTYEGDVITFASAPADGAEISATYTTADHPILDIMPLTATVDTSNAATLTVAIERAVTYPMERPDGTFTDGANGETVFVETIAAEESNSISIALDDLIGRLDDGAWYNLVATVEDQYGQTTEADPILFKVHWEHQAEAPTATFITDETNYIARITPIAPAGIQSGDTCDIYRLSADAPELIISGGTFGVEYVDPFPAFGSLSGYKVVTVTANGDYITEQNTFAEYDTTEPEQEGVYDQLDPGTLVIDYEGERAELPYNISLDNSWEKDFKRTVYLGGHIAGDHNRAVTRDLSASTVVVRGDDADVVAQVRALARYAGTCHVRTPDGSSFAADVQISEGQSFDSAVVEYDLTIQKVDTVDLDGMTYEKWSEQQ